MKITRKKLFGIKDVFDRLSTERTNVLFHYNVAKNKRIIEAELSSLNEAKQLDEDVIDRLKTYESKRVELCKENCLKNENDEPLVIDNRFEFNEEGKKAFNEKLKEISESEEFKSALISREELEKEYENLLSEEVELPLIKFELNKLPTELLGSDIDILFDLIEE